MTSRDPNPCHCGGKPILFTDQRELFREPAQLYMYECFDCRARGKICESEGAALHSWNTKNSAKIPGQRLLFPEHE